MLRDMREKRRRVATAVPEGWHPHQLRGKVAESDPERDAALAQHSAAAMIDAIVLSG